MSDKIDLIYTAVVQNHKEASGRMTRIESDLKEHKDGVIQNRTRIEKLEEPSKALKQIKKWAGWIFTVSAATLAIYKLVEWL